MCNPGQPLVFPCVSLSILTMLAEWGEGVTAGEGDLRGRRGDPPPSRKRVEERARPEGPCGKAGALEACA